MSKSISGRVLCPCCYKGGIRIWRYDGADSKIKVENGYCSYCFVVPPDEFITNIIKKHPEKITKGEYERKPLDKDLKTPMLIYNPWAEWEGRQRALKKMFKRYWHLPTESELYSFKCSMDDEEREFLTGISEKYILS